MLVVHRFYCKCASLFIGFIDRRERSSCHLERPYKIPALDSTKLRQYFLSVLLNKDRTPVKM